jgi:sulfatase-like protein
VPLPVAGLHLGALSALAVAQPLFDLISKNPDFLVARALIGWQVVALGLVLVLVPPLLALGIEALVGLVSRPLRAGVHLLFVVLFVALFAIQALKDIAPSASSGVLILVAAALAVAAAAAYARASGLRSFVTVLSPAPAVFLAVFLFFSPVSDLTFASGSAETADVSSHVPVVMVVFDEVSTIAFEDSHERIDPVLYPNLAALAEDATWFRYATAPTDMTGTATPTILTGSIAERYHPPILSSYPHNLFTLLGRRYRMKVSQEATDLCPRDLCEDASGESAAARDRALASDLGLVYLHVIAPEGIERDLPSVSDTVGNFGADTGSTKTEGSPGHTGREEVLHELGGGRPARFENFVRSIDRTARPTLYYKHSLLPHVPFQYFPDGHRYRTQPHDVIPGLIDEPSWRNEYLLQEAYQRHLLQAGFADRLLGTLVRRLREKNLYDRALIVVTADNGESFLHRGANRHLATPATVEDIADTPLFIKRPFEHSGRVSNRHVRTEDILPTIADVLGIRMPWRVDGESVFDRSAQIPSDIDVYMRSGRKLTLSLRAFRRRIRASLDRKISLFGEHGEEPGLFGIGPHKDLIGRAVNSLPRAPFSADIDDAAAYSAVKLRSDFLPAQLTGTIRDPGPSRTRDLAVALNGRIVAVGQSFRLAGSDAENFSIMLPESAFREGPNSVELLSVTAGGDSLRLVARA